jgi:hypothetical protein
MRQIKDFIIVTGIIAGIVAGLLLFIPQAHAQEEVCFTNTTGYCITGRFLDYWRQNGSLAVFGYPISAARDVVHPETGQAYLTQQFERNRFELHPENAPPYDVLLGRLGADRLRLQNRDWQALPREEGPQPGCLWFAETGRNVCAQAQGVGFKTYWSSHGLNDARLTPAQQSLALFGLPLTSAQMEVNPTDGKIYLIQYFERARFEWHPDNQAPYQVLLGLLGNEVAQAPRLIAGNIVGLPAVTENYLFWVDNRAANIPVYGYNLATQAEFLVTDQPGVKRALVSDGATLVWIDEGGQGRQRIQGYTIATGQVSTILTATDGNGFGDLALADGVLYYQDLAQQRRGFFGYELATRAEWPITSTALKTVARDGMLLWSDFSARGSGPAYIETWRLYRQALNTDQPAIVLAEAEGQGGFSDYAVSDYKVVWSFAPTLPDQRAYLHQIRSDATQAISAEAAFSPVIQGDLIAWIEPPVSAPFWSVRIYDIRSGATTTLPQIQESSLFRLVGIAGQDALAYTTSADQGATALWLSRLP